MNRINKKIILASASPRRKELLTQMGLDFEIKVSGVEEVTERNEPAEMVKELSALKAVDIFERLTEKEKEEALVIGADTVVALDECIMGKPVTEENAIQMLTALQGREHQVYTGVTLVYKAEGKNNIKVKSFYEKTDVFMYPITEKEIKNYVATGEPMDKAGAYAIQGGCAIHIKGINGDYSNVVGLPVGRLYQEMKKIPFLCGK